MYQFDNNITMCRTLKIVYILLLGVTTYALTFENLDPTILQTVTSAETQQRAALKLINEHLADQGIKDVKVSVVIDRRMFKDKKDSFSIRAEKNFVRISGSTGVAACWGIGYYIKNYLKGQIGWQTKRYHLAKPFPEANLTVVANDRIRYVHNPVTASYSFVWWNITDWRKHLIWLSNNGFNMAPLPLPQEAAWSKIYKKLGMTEQEIDQYFTGPAFLSWNRMGNIHGWGGPLSESWHKQQAALKEYVTRVYAMGFMFVIPTFSGHVPEAFSRLYPNSTFHKVSRWNNFDSKYCCGLFLDPNDPLFKVIGKMFWEEIKLPVMLDQVYSAEPFNEISISNFSTRLVQDTAKAIYSNMLEFNENAIWVLQNKMFVNAPNSWPLARVEAFLTSVPAGRMIILDLQSEQNPKFDQYKMYFGQPFIWCMLHNFGGTLGMFGNMVNINKDVYEVRSRVNSTMVGIGLTPEGINQNYVVYELMLESALRKSPVKNMETWITDYAKRRYGCSDTAEAWRYLLKSVYSFQGSRKVMGQYVVTRSPSFKIHPWAWYKSSDLFEAFKNLVFANESNCFSQGYFYDVVDVTRQALQYRAEQLYVNVVNNRNTNLFNKSVEQFLDVLKDMSSILRLSHHFSGTSWFEKARYIGNSTNEKDLYEMNARMQITLWGPNGEFADYACKQWAVMIDDYYYPRWKTFLSEAMASKQANEVFNETAVRETIRNNIEIPYVTMKSKRSVVNLETPKSSAQELARKLYKKWAHVSDLQDLPIEVNDEKPA